MSNLADHEANLFGGNLKSSVTHKLGKVREVLATHCEHREGRLSAGDGAVELVVNLDCYLVLGHYTDRLVKTLCIDDILTLLLDGECLKGGSDTLGHVVCRNSDLVVFKGLDEYALNSCDSTLVGYRTHSRGKLIHKERF